MHIIEVTVLLYDIIDLLTIFYTLRHSFGAGFIDSLFLSTRFRGNWRHAVRYLWIHNAEVTLLFVKFLVPRSQSFHLILLFQDRVLPRVAINLFVFANNYFLPALSRCCGITDASDLSHMMGTVNKVDKFHLVIVSLMGHTLNPPSFPSFPCLRCVTLMRWKVGRGFNGGE